MTREENKEYQKKWYQAHKEEVKARSKKYFEEHKVEQLAKNKIRYEQNKEVILARQKEYRDTHKEQIAETNKKYRQTEAYKRCIEKRKDYRNAYNRQYHKEHREERLEYHRNFLKDYLKTKEGLAKKRILDYNREDRIHNRGEGNLTTEWFVEKIFGSSCVYCGDNDWTHLGADRIDNTRPHTQDNCVCACGICNVERQCKGMSILDFVKYRKNNPRFIDLKPGVVEINGVKVLKKRIKAS